VCVCVCVCVCVATIFNYFARSSNIRPASPVETSNYPRREWR